MKHVSKLLIMMALVIPTQSFAAFESKGDLLTAFAQAGYEYIIALPGGNGTPDVEVQTVDQSSPSKIIQRMHLGDFVRHTKSERPRPELNYVNNQTIMLGLQKKLMGAKYALAYQVSEVLLCYKEKPNTTNYIDCYIFPTNIGDVINALKATKQIK